jgi:hypothetical protein
VDFVTEYPRLEPAQQDRFREIVTRLLSGRVLTPGSAMRPDPDWRFAERHRELIDGYLRLGGWISTWRCASVARCTSRASSGCG